MGFIFIFIFFVFFIFFIFYFIFLFFIFYLFFYFLFFILFLLFFCFLFIFSFSSFLFFVICIFFIFLFFWIHFHGLDMHKHIKKKRYHREANRLLAYWARSQPVRLPPTPEIHPGAPLPGRVLRQKISQSNGLPHSLSTLTHSYWSGTLILKARRLRCADHQVSTPLVGGLPPSHFLSFMHPFMLAHHKRNHNTT